MTPSEYGERVAARWSPVTAEQVEEIAKVLATVELEQGLAA